jgi:hypothetical protein
MENKSNKIGNILYYLLLLRNQMKIYHWQTKLYSRHIATDSLVEDLDKLTDKYVEIYSGIYENIEIHEDKSLFKLNNICDKNIVSYLNALKKIISTETSDITDSELLNVRDDILGKIDNTIYLYRLQ